MDNPFFKYRNENPPKKGSLLISEPHLPDNNFERSVILLCEHSEEGSFGFVLNKAADMSLSSIMSNAQGLDFPVGVGGPVERNTLHFLHRNNADLEMSTPITESIYWGGDYDQVTEKLRFGDSSEKDFLFFVGYSGWSAGQLDEEIEHNSWIVFPKATEQLVFNTRKNISWKEVLSQMGGRFSIYANYPSDPRLN